ncbi:MAG: ribbon-helix-helix domain-containing protein [Clostridium sp.]|nr:ribbon-helix-helix domain-containing protein [Clostridium sp.]
MDNKLVIQKKPLKGDDNHKTFSIRIKADTADKLDQLASKTQRTRNELINIMLDFAIDNCEIDES